MNMNEPRSSGAVGPVIGVVVIVAIILIGGIYFFMNKQAGLNYEDNRTTEENSSTTNIELQSASSEPDSIRDDLNSFGPDEIDSSTTVY